MTRPQLAGRLVVLGPSRGQHTLDAERDLADTERYWRDWASRCRYRGPFRDSVVRSLITLKALTYAPAGGIAAAGTTSLPEQIGGGRNWDYRYCWIRDAAMTDLVTSVSISGTVDGLSPGTYYWSATAAPGYELQGASSGQFTIADCGVSVTVAPGVCVATGQGAAGTAEVTIDPDTAATVEIYSDAAMTNLVTTVSASGTVSGLAPGTYYWSADPQAGFDLSGSDEGQFTIAPCEVTVDVSGASKILAEDLKTVDASIDASGASNVNVNVSGVLKSDASGASSILYAGSPSSVQKKTSGASRVSPK